MKTLAKLLLFLSLLALPFVVRWFLYGRTTYQAPEIPSVSSDDIVLSTAAYNPYADQPTASNGRVIIDLAHENNLQIDDLTPLSQRLSARGAEIEMYTGNDGSLPELLRGATALVVVAPTGQFSADELDAIQSFVADGGRLLLAADPTRPATTEDEYYDLSSVLFPISAVPAANSLANLFGVSYFDDYLYNLNDNSGNYRNVRFEALDGDQPLFEGLDTLVLYASHSLRGGEVTLLAGDAKTRSNVRTGESSLAAAVFAEAGRVLVMGDMTFMTSPYHTMADNDHFLSNLADWLAADGRAWDVRDFPYLFTRPVSLVQTFAEALDPEMLTESIPLQAAFEDAGLEAALRTAPDAGGDVLYLGLYDKTEPLDDILDRAGVTVDLADGGLEPADDGTGASPKDLVLVEDLGGFVAQNTALYIETHGADQRVLTVLASDEEMLVNAIARLVAADFSGCVSSGSVLVCDANVLSSEQSPPPDEPGEDAGQDGGMPVNCIESYASGYMSCTDEAGVLKVDVPVGWLDYDGSGWYVDGEMVGPGLAAAPDLAAYETSYDASGMFFGVSADLAQTGGDYHDLLAAYQDVYGPYCETAERLDYDDGVYVGQYDHYTNCSGYDAYVLATVPSEGDPPVVLLVIVQVPMGESDVVDQVWATFVIIGDV